MIVNSRELKPKSRYTLALTQVGEVVVSTVRLSDEVKYVDRTIVGLEEYLGVNEEDLDRPARLAEPGDFETMVFSCDPNGEVNDWTEKDFARYFSKEEALEGHKTMVEKYLFTEEWTERVYK